MTFVKTATTLLRNLHLGVVILSLSIIFYYCQWLNA